MSYTPKFEDIQRIREKDRYAECDHIATHVDSAMNSESTRYSHPDYYQWAGGDVVEAYVRKRVAEALAEERAG